MVDISDYLGMLFKAGLITEYGENTNDGISVNTTIMSNLCHLTDPLTKDIVTKINSLISDQK